MHLSLRLHILIMTLLVLAPGSATAVVVFMTDVELVPVSPTRPTRPNKPPVKSAVRKAQEAREDAKTEATTLDPQGKCPDGRCGPPVRRRPALPPQPEIVQAADDARAEAQESSRPATSSSAQKCYAQAILDGAKDEAKKAWRNRPSSGGQCAKGVRQGLSRAGVWRGGGMGDAYGYHSQGHLRRMGFRNIMGPGITAENAPPGAVLVFAGPLTPAPLPPKKRRGGKRAGEWVGHITVKGDDGRYYTDGRTIFPAAKRRTLAAVYVMETCATCTPALKRKCGQ